MKKLQSNFTTPEQSKRLLEMGVPAWTADCFFGGYGGHPDYKTIRQTEFEIEDDSLFKLNDHLTPCWSVGRLIEIMKVCMPSGVYTPKFYYDCSLMQVVLDAIELEFDYGLDFSKLEDK